MYSRVPACQVSTYYYIGFAYMMMRRYQDAIRTFSNILLYNQRTKHMVQNRTYVYDQVRSAAARGRHRRTRRRCRFPKRRSPLSPSSSSSSSLFGVEFNSASEKKTAQDSAFLAAVHIGNIIFENGLKKQSLLLLSSPCSESSSTEQYANGKKKFKFFFYVPFIGGVFVSGVRVTRLIIDQVPQSNSLSVRADQQAKRPDVHAVDALPGPAPDED